MANYSIAIARDADSEAFLDIHVWPRLLAPSPRTIAKLIKRDRSAMRMLPQHTSLEARLVRFKRKTEVPLKSRTLRFRLEGGQVVIEEKAHGPVVVS